MATSKEIKNELVQDFANGYQSFGLSKLMGRVVGLLMAHDKPLSLDEIADELHMSKGPISQITRRLRDHYLIRKVWKPGSRKDFYEIEPEVFSQAFKNNFDQIKKNTKLAKKIRDKIESSDDPEIGVLYDRVNEMEHFYTIMEKHYQNFLDEWATERKKLYQKPGE
ncbi:MAG: hypothetical protein JJ895_08420 [Balneolaceae bacterium]|nr:hypothetical protein [Balneolaceae bacterium]